MAVDSEQKRWSMLAFASNPIRTHVFNPATSGLSSIEKITTLQYYGGNAWDGPVALPSTDEIFPLYYRTLITDTVVNTTFISAQSVASVLVTDKVISSATINGNTFASVRIP